MFWKTHKQGSVTKYPTFAEYVALSEAVTEILNVKEFLKTFDIEISSSIQVYKNNFGAVLIANNRNLTKNSKYIEVHYSFLHEL